MTTDATSDTATWIHVLGPGTAELVGELQAVDGAGDASAVVHEVLDGPGAFLVIGDQAPDEPLRSAAETTYRAELVSDSGPVDRPTSHRVVVGFPVPDEALDRFDHWYETEHSPLLLGAEDWLRVRRYRVQEGTGPLTCLAVHDLASPAAMESPQRQEAARAPLRMAIATEGWYARSGRWTCRTVGPTLTG